MQFTGEVTSVQVVAEINMIWLYQTMIGRLRQLSEPKLRQQAGIEKSQTPVERDILVQWERNHNIRVILNSDAHFRQRYCSQSMQTFTKCFTNAL